MYQVDDKQYGIPFDLGMVGFWYNKDLFEQAGITAPPATWDELLEDVGKLKDAGITPLALGEGDKWPGMFWWAYLALRIGGADAMLQAGEDGSFDSESFVEAGTQLQRLIEMDPFQSGFLAAVWDGAGGQAATIATEGAAMHLMGQWAPGTQEANSPDGEGLGDKLGWFPFPSVDGGAGEPTDAFGGGNGFAVGKDAPPEAVEFLRVRHQPRRRQPVGRDEQRHPARHERLGVVDHRPVPHDRARRPGRTPSYVQLYLDQAYDPELGAVINDAVQELFAGQASAGAGRPDDRGCGRRAADPTTLGRRSVLDGPPPPDHPADAPAAGRVVARRSSGRRGGSGRRSSCSCSRRSSCTSCSSSCRSARASTTAGSTGTASTPLTDFVGLQNYRDALADPVFLASLRHVFVIVVLSLALQLPFALGLAVLLNQRIRGRAVLRLLFFLPFVLSEVITAVVWRLLLQPAGLVDRTLEAARSRRTRPGVARRPATSCCTRCSSSSRGSTSAST